MFKRGGVFENVKICGATATVAVVPHPSCLNRVWVDLRKYPKACETLEKMKTRITSAL